LAGQAGSFGSADGIGNARFNNPIGIAVDSANNLYVADEFNNAIRRVVLAPTPQLTGMTLSNGVPQFVLNGPVGSNYVIQSSSNLVNWLALSANTIPAGGAVPIVDPSMTNQPRRFYRALPQVFERITIPANSGTITSPFIITNGYVYQRIETGVANGGRAVYNFTTTNTLGHYFIQVLVNAPNDGANSIFLNIDAEPQDPYMIWDIPITSGFMQQTAAWRGNGTFDNDEFVPKVFILNPGAHQLIIRGREANTLFQTITILMTGAG
jgi:hypothetical protein